MALSGSRSRRAARIAARVRPLAYCGRIDRLRKCPLVPMPTECGRVGVISISVLSHPLRHSRHVQSISTATPLEEPDKLAGRFPLEPTRPEETPLRKQLVILASSALLICSGVALAQQETPQQYDKSGAPSGLQSTTPDRAPVVSLPEANTAAPETTGQAPSFEDRWSAQRETTDRLPTATMPGADAPRTTDQGPRPLLDQGNGNWDPPPVTAPSTQR
jgi:hypothetical protein